MSGAEIVDAELVEPGELMPAPPTAAGRPLVDQHTVLFPGQDLPTAADRPQYSKRDLDVSDETAARLQDTDPTGTGPMVAFTAWCAQHGRIPVPCTTATYTDYAQHLMARGLKVSTIKNYMSLIKTAMPAGKKPDNSLYLRLLANYRKNNKRALRVRRAFPITLPYLIPMMEKAEADNRPIGWRDAAMLAFGYRFLARSVEEVNLDIEDLTVMDDRIVVWLLEDKTHNNDQTLILHDHPDLDMVKRMRRWLEHLAAQGITAGPLFRHLQKDGTVAVGHRERVATVRGEYLRPQTVNDRVKYWFSMAGLVSDGRPVSSHGLRAGAATDLGMNDATDQEIAEAGRWRPDSTIPRLVYVRPAQAAKRDPFARVPRVGVGPAEEG
ncbi:tyrosine-type recombinase/integrase [Streptomyces xantholiticus]|uniref:Tyrosine-type recombinase/integrase n=1 Tax=Streptomyces xantholiticus TaxID=68285 RepID=A0ABV1UZT5_9ACTN